MPKKKEPTKALHKELSDTYRLTMEQLGDYNESIKDPALYINGYIEKVKPLLPLAAKSMLRNINVNGILLQSIEKPDIRMLYLVPNQDKYKFFEYVINTNGKEINSYLNIIEVLDTYDFNTILGSINRAIRALGQEKANSAAKHKKSKEIIDRYKKEEPEFIRTVELIKSQLLLDK